SLMGSGYFLTLADTLFPPSGDSEAVRASLRAWDVTDALPRLADRPLFLWHGEADDVVPAGATFRLRQAWIRAGLDKRLTCVWEAGVRHRITPTALDATVDFFLKNL